MRLTEEDAILGGILGGWVQLSLIVLQGKVVTYCITGLNCHCVTGLSCHLLCYRVMLSLIVLQG